MTLLIAYDITDNSLRKKIADYLLYAGLYRVQKSVFIGYASRETKTKIVRKMRELNNQSSNEEDKIIIMPIHAKSFISAIFMGDYNEDMILDLTGKIKVRIY